MMQRPARPDDHMFPYLGFGLGLRPAFYADVLAARSPLSWLEVISENYLGEGGRPLAKLETLRADYAIVLHGVSLSIGSSDPLNATYLRRLKGLIDRIEPAVVSDHCCWTSVDGENLHDLLPLPYTSDVARYVSERISRVQDFLGRRILIENVSSYLSLHGSEMSEWEFLSEIARKADCGLLLDVNNVYVSSVNHNFDPLCFLAGLPRERVGQIHLAGHSEQTTPAGRRFLLDTHDAAVCPEVWELYRQALLRFGPVNTMIEWDSNIPAYSVLVAEITKAQAIEEQLYGPSQTSEPIASSPPPYGLTEGPASACHPHTR